MFSELEYVKAALVVHLQRAREARQRNEYGVSAVEWVIITAFLVLIATAIYGILGGAIRGKASSINL